MSCEERNGSFHYRSERAHHEAPAALLEGRYGPVEKVFSPQPGTLEHFLTERYCLYTADSRGELIRGEIHHSPWPLQVAEAKFSRNTMTEAVGIPLPASKPLLHFAKRQDVVLWRPERLA
jgi:uncharacterized protein YqjF (DUF2071 family)